MAEQQSDWIEKMLRREGFAISRDLQWLLAADSEALWHYFWVGNEANDDWSARLQRQIPIAHVVPIARRIDDDFTIAMVMDDPVHPRGEILVVLDDFSSHCGTIEATYPTVDSWARDARKDIRVRRFLGRCGRFAPLVYWVLRRLSRSASI